VLRPTLTETSCSHRLHCAEWSCVVLSDSPRHRNRSGRDWPDMWAYGKLTHARARSAHRAGLSYAVGQPLVEEPRQRASAVRQLYGSDPAAFASPPTAARGERSRSASGSSQLIELSLLPNVPRLDTAHSGSLSPTPLSKRQGNTTNRPRLRACSCTESRR